MKLTAVVITHKLEQYVHRAIASVLTQTRRPDRIILLGTDCRAETLDALMRWEGLPGVEIHVTQKPLTCAASKNYAASVLYMEDEAFFTLDADDWISPHYVEKCMGAMEAGGYAVVGCDYQVINPYGYMAQASANKADIADVVNLNPLPSCSIIRRSAFEEMGGYDESFAFEDWGLWLRLWQSGAKMSRYPLTMFTYLKHATNKSKGDDLFLARQQIADLVDSLSHA